MITPPATRRIQLGLDIEEEDEEEIQVESIGDWKNIIFYPFARMWQWLLIMSIFIEICLVIFEVMYDLTFVMRMKVMYMYYAFEIFYFIDTVLCIMHRRMSYHAKLRVYEARNLFTMSIDVLTLIPIYETMILIMKSSVGDEYVNRHISEYVKLKIIPRVYRIVVFFTVCRKMAGLNQIVIVGIRHFIILVLISHTVASIWYQISCWLCRERNWTVNLKDHIFDSTKSLDWWTICYCEVANKFAHNSTGLIKGEIFLEKLIMLLMMLIGFIFHIMVFNAQLTAAFIKVFKKQFDYTKRLKGTMLLMKQWNIPKETRSKLNDYYSEMWLKRRGIMEMPKIFQTLPTSLQKEVTVDMFWEALRHSHVFKGLDMAFKRAISLVMKSEFYLAGDYLLKLGERNHRMIYIATGVIQILSDEDDESPVVSFSSGTIIGEVGGLINCHNSAHVRCATYCEMYTLSLADCFRVVSRGFRSRTKSILTQIRGRLEHGKELHDIAVTHSEFRAKHAGYTSESSIKWLKHRWRLMARLQRKNARLDDELLERELDVSHSSENLDLLVLSADVELKMQAICLTNSFPYVMEPDSSFRRVWDYVHLFAVFFTCIVLPYVASYIRKIPFKLQYFLLVVNLITTIDIVVQLCTAIKKKGHLISKPSLIVINRCKDFWFLIDVVATLPINMAAKLLGASEHICSLLTLNRCLKIYKLVLVVRQREKTLKLGNFFLIVKYIFIYSMIGYWLMCVVHAIACFKEDCDPNSWYIYNIKMDGFFGASTDLAIVVQMVYYVCSIYLAIGGTDRYQYNILDTFISHVITMIGYYLFSFCFSELCATTVHHIQVKTMYVERLVNLRKILWHARITSMELKTKVLDYVSFQWNYNSEVDYTNVRETFTECSKELQHKIVDERIIAALKRVRLFQDCDDHFLKCLAKTCVLRLLPANSIISMAGSVSENIHIVLQGYVSIMSQMAGDEQRKTRTILTEGDSFGIIETLHNINMFVSAESVTVVELLRVSKFNLLKLLKAFPLIQNDFNEALRAHSAANRNTIHSLGGRLQPQFAPEESLGQGDYFKYVIYDEKTELQWQQYMRPFEKLGKWKFIRYFLLRKAIDPTKRFFIIWEIFRCITIVVAMTLVWLGKILVQYATIMYYLKVVVNLIAIPDFYIRLHMQFYNENGLTVSHSLKTAQHYLKANFAVDLLSALPLILFNPQRMSGNEKVFALCAIMLLKELSYYRIVGLMSHYQSDANWTRTKIIQITKYFLLIVTALLTLSCVNQDLVCEYKVDENGDIIDKCEEQSWLTTSYFSDIRGPPFTFMYSLYIVILSFTSGVSGVFPTQTKKEVIWFLLLFFVGFVVRWYILAMMTSLGIIGHTSLIKYRGHVKVFSHFMDKEYVDESLAEVTISHFEHVWERTRGSRISQVLSKLHNHLYMDVAYHMYGKTIKNVGLFRGLNKSFIMMFCHHIEQQYYQKDAEIIRCNDVQEYIFIVYKGRVDIVIANQKITSLENGGAFGNFSSSHKIRQTIKAIAHVHTDLLVIENKMFQRLVAEVPGLNPRIYRANSMTTEYFEPISLHEEESTPSYLTFQKHLSKLKTCWGKFNPVINRNNFWYKIYNYLISVHLAPMGTIVILHLMFISPHDIILTRRCIIYTLDTIFLTKLWFNSHVSYMDAESGIMVMDFTQIWRKYIRNLFVLDLISILPIEVIVRIFTDDYKIIRYIFMNRLLRFLYLERYYKECKDKLAVNIFLKWAHLFYWLIMFLQVMTCCWYLSACIPHNCRYVDQTRKVPEHVYAKTKLDDNILAYSYVINVFTTTGMRDSSPTSLTQLIVSIIISFGSLYLMGIMTSAFASILVMENFRMMEYEYNIDILREYLEDQNISPVLIKNTWDYLTLVWTRQSGEITPVLIQNAPSYLKQDVMMGLYGKYISSHSLFARTHVDFIRQLVCYFRRCVFFPGNTIVEKGDMDGTLYFVHVGEVEKYEVMGNNYVLMKTLTKGASFGEGQGIYAIPHPHTYKALTTVEVVTIQRSDWMYLLYHFPASKEEIERRSLEEGLTRLLTNKKIPVDFVF